MTKTHLRFARLIEPLLTPDEYAEAMRLRRALRSAAATREELVCRGWLTPLQARWLAHGRSPVVGPYLILEKIGSGGMGTVHLARHRGLNRLAALKTARPGQRFVREIEALGRVDHPNVVHAYDAGEGRAVAWVALEYVSGPDLGKLVRVSGPLDAGRACSMARQTALGLQHLHDLGLVHRDIKPANLALTADGQTLKVLDVGLVGPRWRTAADTGLTRAGVALGSMDYLAPEQVLDPRRAGARADQYGLGCTLYHLLTGSVPFPGGSPAARATRRLRKTAATVESLRPELPAGLGDVVRRLMSRRARDRFPNAADAAAALAPFVATSPAVLAA